MNGHCPERCCPPPQSAGVLQARPHARPCPSALPLQVRAREAEHAGAQAQKKAAADERYNALKLEQERQLKWVPLCVRPQGPGWSRLGLDGLGWAPLGAMGPIGATAPLG
jgi:hypothetical protein